MSPGFPSDPARLGCHCVSRPPHDDSRRFFNQNSYLRAHYVSRHPEVQLAQRHASVLCATVRGPHLSPKLRLQPILFIPIALSSTPRRACPPVTFLLALALAAHVLAISHAGVGLEPSMTDPARALLHHRPRVSLPPSLSFLLGGREPPDLLRRRFDRNRSRPDKVQAPDARRERNRIRLLARRSLDQFRRAPGRSIRAREPRGGSVFTSRGGSFFTSAKGSRPLRSLAAMGRLACSEKSSC
jgi:hypothetical protein